MNKMVIRLVRILCIIGILILLIVSKTQFLDYYKLSGDNIPTIIHVTGKGVIFSFSVGSAGDDILQTYTYKGISSESAKKYADFLMIQEGFIEHERTEDSIRLVRKSGEAGKINVVVITMFEGRVTVHLEKISIKQ